MIGQWHTGRKDKPVRIYSSGCSFLSQVGGSCRIVLQKPKNACIDALENMHPRIKGIRKDLIGLIEAAKNKCIFGKLNLCSTWNSGPGSKPLVGNPISVREPHNFF